MLKAGPRDRENRRRAVDGIRTVRSRRSDVGNSRILSLHVSGGDTRH